MRVASANEASSFCMASSGSVEQRKDVGKGERNQHQRRHDPEDGFVGSSNLGNRADLAWLARLHRTEDASPGKGQRYQRRPDEDRAIGFEYRQVADPGTAEAECHEHKRAEAAG